MNSFRLSLFILCLFGPLLTADKEHVLHADVDLRAPYYALPMNGIDKDRTYQLIDQMGNKAWYELLWNKRKMEKLGDQVDHVHPLRFSGFIFSQPHLKESMKKVRSFSLKWYRFVDGFGGKMKRNAQSNNLLVHVPGFCHETGADEATVRKLIKEQNWEALLSHCIDQ